MKKFVGILLVGFMVIGFMLTIAASAAFADNKTNDKPTFIGMDLYEEMSTKLEENEFEDDPMWAIHHLTIEGKSYYLVYVMKGTDMTAFGIYDHFPSEAEIIAVGNQQMTIVSRTTFND